LSPLILFLLVASSLSCNSNSSNGEDQPNENLEPTTIFIGTYTRDEGWVNGQAEGIYSAVIEEEGTLGLVGTTTEIVNPSFLATSPDRRHLYAVSELGRSGESGFVYAYSINSDLSLTYIDRYPTNAGSPAHISTDEAGSMVFVANYQGGVAMVYSRKDDGSLEFVQQLNHSGSGPHPRQESAHVHQTKLSPDQNFLYLPDLGSDKIWSYHIDYNSQTLSKTEQEFVGVAGGAGPRHMDFHPTLDIAYIMNELNSTVSVMAYNAQTGALTEIQTIRTLPDTYFGDNTTADIHVHPNGRFLYGSNRGFDSIVSYSIDENSGELTLLDYVASEGEFPRNFGINPTGDMMYVANQNSNNIAIYTINEDTGALTFTGEELSVPTPVCITFY
ncbi:MAG: lactonase family protein, partial [Balneolales bacterium]|nr:lactonase family protein [Balneolales bacterium]